MKCKLCNTEYDKKERLGKPGLVSHCNECAEEEGDIDCYTGNMIYSHKAGASIQINNDPALTEYINAATKLKNKGSNLGNNLKVSSRMNTRTNGACAQTADAFNYKNRTEE